MGRPPPLPGSVHLPREDVRSLSEFLLVEGVTRACYPSGASREVGTAWASIREDNASFAGGVHQFSSALGRQQQTAHVGRVRRGCLRTALSPGLAGSCAWLRDPVYASFRQLLLQGQSLPLLRASLAPATRLHSPQGPGGDAQAGVREPGLGAASGPRARLEGRAASSCPAVPRHSRLPGT